MSSTLHYLLRGDSSSPVNWTAVLRTIQRDPTLASIADPSSGRTPLSLALSKTDPPPPATVVKALLDATTSGGDDGDDPSSSSSSAALTQADVNGHTPLYYALSNFTLGEDVLAVLGLQQDRSSGRRISVAGNLIEEGEEENEEEDEGEDCDCDEAGATSSSDGRQRRRDHDEAMDEGGTGPAAAAESDDGSGRPPSLVQSTTPDDSGGSSDAGPDGGAGSSAVRAHHQPAEREQLAVIQTLTPSTSLDETLRTAGGGPLTEEAESAAVAHAHAMMAVNETTAGNYDHRLRQQQEQQQQQPEQPPSFPLDGAAHIRRGLDEHVTFSSRFDVSTVDPPSAHGGGNDDTNPEYEGMTHQIHRKHGRVVSYVKILIMIVLLVSAITVTVLAYRTKKLEEENRVTTQYDIFAARVVDMFRHDMDMKLYALHTTLAMFDERGTGTGTGATSPWPNVTVPDFDSKVTGMLLLSHAWAVGFGPVLTNVTRAWWEAHAAAEEMAAGEGVGGVGDDDSAVPPSSQGSVATSTEGGGGPIGLAEPFSHAVMDDGASEAAGEMTTIDVFFGNGGSGNGNDDAGDEGGGGGRRRGRRGLLRGRGGGRPSLRRRRQRRRTAAGGAEHGTEHGTMDAPDHHLGSVDSGGGQQHQEDHDLPPHAEGEGSIHANATSPPGDRQPRQRKISDGMYKFHGSEAVDETDAAGPYVPLWQIAPATESNRGGIMYNQYSEPVRRRAIDTVLSHAHPALTEILYESHDWHADEDHHDEPNSILFYPISSEGDGHGHGGGGHDDDDDNPKATKVVVGTMGISFSWSSVFRGILPSDIAGVVCLLETSTGQAFTYEIKGMDATFLGAGDLHDPKYDHMELAYTHSLHDVDLYFEENGGDLDAGHHSGHRRRLGLRAAAAAAARGRDLEEMAHGVDDEGHGQDDGATIADEGGIDDVNYTIKLYPSDTFRANYVTNDPVIHAIVIALIFFLTSATFIIYDCLVERRQTAVMQSAMHSDNIVRGFFPAVVRDRLFKNAEGEMYHEVGADAEQQGQGEENNRSGRIQRLLSRKVSSIAAASRSTLTNFDSSDKNLPIADLFTDTTILFADIAGFTAWSSEREPTQVFQLLEALFREFDTEAKKHGVFKVETIGDCYVAVTGLPDPRPDHAVAMSKFAQKCLTSFSFLTHELELSLGPGTAELGMRIGLHSGPVTAGVLRGEKARFQLFGDTMNTASRMESTGQKNMIQISQQTADLLIAAGKESFIIPRGETVHAKGKGTMQTYWLKPKVVRRNSSQCGSASSLPWQFEEEQVQGTSQATSEQKPALDKHESFYAIDTRSLLRKKSSELNSGSWKNVGIKDAETATMQPSKLVQRLITWNAAVLEPLVIKVMDHRRQQSRRKNKPPWAEETTPQSSTLFSDEVAEAVKFQSFDRDTAMTRRRGSATSASPLPPEARRELHEYVTRIASMYRNVHFHNFEHASHVTMSANKLMRKVCSRDFGSGGSNPTDTTRSDNDSMGVDLFFSTFGISSDPLAQLAVVFAALVHDVDHVGVPNVRLVQEQPDLGEKYQNKSVAENNSIHVAWSVLMEPGFANLRRCMFSTDCDRDRFRQLLINVVIATDIADSDRRQKEQARWQKAFSNISSWEEEWQNKTDNELASIDVSLKATVVLEQIMLASDVAHTMQHFLTFTKWNERLYRELWAAYLNGRAEKDPTIGWYEDQIGFFDGYIIPLARKLKECGVFGSAGDEYLGNALSNREEWTDKGKEISEMFERTIRNNRIVADDEPNYWMSH